MLKALPSILCLFLCLSISAQTTILDFETPETTTNFQYFGSSLDGTVNMTIANPDMSGINTSAMVSEHIRPANSETFAGAFAAPAPAAEIDFTTDNQACMKVWLPVAGDVRLKLEASTNGGENWLASQVISETETWVEVCFQANQPSLEGPFQAATGFSYASVVVFFNFGEVTDTDHTYYMDDLIVSTSAGDTDGDVTFSVDMNDYAGAFTTPYVAGSFNSFSPDANPMQDTDGDGVWETTIADIPFGAHEYKIQLDQWAQQEIFNGGELCTITSPDGQFVNRRLVVSADATIPTHCFNSCFACGDAVTITIELGQGAVAPDVNGFFIAGGGNFGNPGDNPLSDDDMDGVWTIELERQRGFSSFYTFTNGACPDYSCKENIAGQSCSNPNAFDDRFMDPVMQDTTIATCFAICSESATDCGVMVEPANITFAVDMNDYMDAFTVPHVSGMFNNWSGDANPLVDADGNGIYATTIQLNPGDYEFKFTLDNWMAEEIFQEGDPCTVTSPDGQFTNRILTVTEDELVCFEFNTCTSCTLTSTDDLEVDLNLFSLAPTIATDQTTLYFAQEMNNEKTVQLYSITGNLLREVVINASASEHQLSVSDLSGGLYFVTVRTANKIATRKLIKQ